jgi:oligopeptide/dipeptide ABC transporter ATP-binding protein
VTAPLLDVSGLCVQAFAAGGWTAVVEDVGLRVEAGRIRGLIGESGCGKTMTALTLLGMEGYCGWRRTAGRALCGGRDLFAMDEPAWRAFRGTGAAMIFQEPLSALNPVLTAGRQAAEVMAAHGLASATQAKRRVLELFASTGIDDPAFAYDAYPFQLSGGMRQRVAIAMALAGEPRLLVADEPTTALDVTIQAQILRLLRRVVDARAMGLVLITHDLGVAAELCDEVTVMYAGEVVENADVFAFYDGPAHPYAAGLLASLPSRSPENGSFGGIEGSVPTPGNYPPGCRFAPRCPRADDICRATRPRLEQIAPGRFARCFYPLLGAST